MTLAVAPPQIATTCPYCGVGCGVLASPDGLGGAGIAGDPSHPANKGRLCVKGTALGETLGLGGRLLYPMIDRQRTTWNRALERVARDFQRIRKDHGPQSIAFYLSGQLLTEDYYVANKLMKGFLGSANVDTNSRLCMASSVAGHRRAFGADTVPGCYEDLDAADLIVLVGSNAAWCHPVLFQRMQDARRRGASLINIDPRRTASSQDADLHLSIRPGMDGVLFSWLLACIAGSPVLNADYLAHHVSGFDAALARAREIAPSLPAVAAATGLAEEDITRFTALWLHTGRVVTCYSQGVNQSAQGTDKVNAILNCHLATGRIGRLGMGPFSLTGQPNAMGGREVGGLANQLAAHMGFSAPEVDRVQRFWNAPDMARHEGLKAVDMFEAVESGTIKALWVMCTNPAVSLPRADAMRKALARLDCLVVSESHAGVDGLLDHAHVILPAAPWGEKDGTVTNSERRISRQRAFLPPAGEAKPDWWMVCEVAKRMGFGAAFNYASAADIFYEHAALSSFENAGTRDFDLGGLANAGTQAFDMMEPVQWPLRTGQSEGTRRLFGQGGFFTPDGKARMVAIAPPKLASEASPQWPYLLNTGRVRDHWHTMSRTGLSPRLARHRQEPFAQINPRDAKALGIAEGDYVQIANAHGTAVVLAVLDDAIQPGHVFAPIHWNGLSAGGSRIGALVHGFNDPYSGQPESKAVPVALSREPMQAFGVLVARQRATLPSSLVHARIRLDGEAEGTCFASRDNPAAVFAMMQNHLPAMGSLSQVTDPKAGIYRAISMAGQRLEAALFVGPERDTAILDWLAGHFARLDLARQEKTSLLAGRSPNAGPDLGPIICACHAVRRAVILNIITAGAASVEAIGSACKAGTNCGSCKPELKQFLGEGSKVAG